MTAGLAALFISGCWIGGSGPAEDEPAQSSDRTVIVQNDNFSDVHVYIIGRSGSRTDLGLASSFSESRFQMPLDRLVRDQFNVLIDPVGGGRPKLIPDIYFPENAEALKVVVGADIGLSHIVIR